MYHYIHQISRPIGEIGIHNNHLNTWPVWCIDMPLYSPHYSGPSEILRFHNNDLNTRPFLCIDVPLYLLDYLGSSEELSFCNIYLNTPPTPLSGVLVCQSVNQITRALLKN